MTDFGTALWFLDCNSFRATNRKFNKMFVCLYVLLSSEQPLQLALLLLVWKNL